MSSEGDIMPPHFFKKKEIVTKEVLGVQKSSEL